MSRRTIWDWLLLAITTLIFVFLAAIARLPEIPLHWTPAAILISATLALFLWCGAALYRTTRFH